MTANPLLLRQPARPGKVTVEMLEGLVVSLNNTAFIKDSGKPYFVGKRINSASALEHFLDRR